MEIKKFLLERPDSDGDRSIELEFDVTNETDEDILLIRYDAFYSNASGYLIASDMRTTQDCFLEKGDSEKLSGWGVIKERYLQGDEEPNVRVQARLFKREFFKLGSLKVSEKEGVEYFESEISSPTIGEKIKVSISRLPPDDAGDVRIECQCPIVNISDSYLESPELKIALLDRTGAEIDYSTSSNDVSPHSMTTLDPSIWGVKPKKLKGATIEISLTVFQQVALISQSSGIKSAK